VWSLRGQRGKAWETSCHVLGLGLACRSGLRAAAVVEMYSLSLPLLLPCENERGDASFAVLDNIASIGVC